MRPTIWTPFAERRRQTMRGRWLRRLIDPLKFLAGDRLLNSAGYRMLNSSGNPMLSNGVDNSCCCGIYQTCASYTTATLSFADIDLDTACRVCNSPGAVGNHKCLATGTYVTAGKIVVTGEDGDIFGTGAGDTDAVNYEYLTDGCASYAPQDLAGADLRIAAACAFDTDGAYWKICLYSGTIQVGDNGGEIYQPTLYFCAKANINPALSSFRIYNQIDDYFSDRSAFWTDTCGNSCATSTRRVAGKNGYVDVTLT